MVLTIILCASAATSLQSAVTLLTVGAKAAHPGLNFQRSYSLEAIQLNTPILFSERVELLQQQQQPPFQPHAGEGQLMGLILQPQVALLADHVMKLWRQWADQSKKVTIKDQVWLPASAVDALKVGQVD